ncbi:hypothetical protein RDI58_010790 [Solanum bulbocastanum]|uniref:Uncharacterized protein n=1 Tax=Solanum bulbocastanum TaxID=147425 RepID=A0AAN8YFP9_SOLBU
MTIDQVNNMSVSDEKEKVQEEELHGEIEAPKELPDGNQESELITGIGEANTSLLQDTTTQEGWTKVVNTMTDDKTNRNKQGMRIMRTKTRRIVQATSGQEP